MYREYMKFTLCTFDEGLVTIRLGCLDVPIEDHLQYELKVLHDDQDVPLEGHLQYELKVLHGDQVVKEIEISKFHMALYTFKKTIDLEVQANVQG